MYHHPIISPHRLVPRKETDLKLEMFDVPDSRYIRRYKHSMRALEESNLHDLTIPITSLQLLNLIGEGLLSKQLRPSSRRNPIPRYGLALDKFLALDGAWS